MFFLAVTSATSATASEFPVDIEHRYGATTIERKPTRIVSIGFIEHDFLLSLGIKPHGLRKWYGNDPYGVWLWGHEALGDAKPHVMQGEINIEQIAALKPDLIIGLWSGVSEREYNLLSKIAPTLPPQKGVGDYGMSWQAMLRTIAIATGTMAKGDEIISALDKRMTDIRNAHPNWQGATASVVWIGQVGAYSENDIRAQLLRQLGFEISESVNKLADKNHFYALIPAENLEPIDTDILIWIDHSGSIKPLGKMPLRRFMRAKIEGREIYADPLLSAAFSHSSPLSINYVLDALVPLITQAIDGNPATQVNSSAEVGILELEGAN